MKNHQMTSEENTITVNKS